MGSPENRQHHPAERIHTLDGATQNVHQFVQNRPSFVVLIIDVPARFDRWYVAERSAGEEPGAKRDVGTRPKGAIRAILRVLLQREIPTSDPRGQGAGRECIG